MAVAALAGDARARSARGPALRQDVRAIEHLGTPCTRPGTGAAHARPCSTRSSSVGSAQWMSSSTATSGRSAARTSNSRRTPQNISSTAYTLGTSPMADATRSAASAISPASATAARAQSGRIVLGDVGCERTALRGEQPERDALAVGQAAAVHHHHQGAGARDELAQQPRLADARLAQHRDHPPGAGRGRRADLIAQELQIVVATDERSRGRALAAGQGDQPEGRHPLGLALQLQRLDRLGLDRVADEQVCERAQERLHRRRRLLEPRRHVHGVTGRKPLVPGRLVGHDLAGVHAGAIRHRHAVVAVERNVERVQAAAHVERRPHGPQRIVLMRLRQPEHRHDGVADELLDGAAVTLDGRPHDVEVAPHHLP